ncbi:MAG: hypothetical protein RLZ22_849 [Verrucomicrobiota bacterium]|jgi:SAM-dependent MidA family methyltransferase
METTIRFEEFMRRALHDPHDGYYAKNIKGIGRCGDFTTAPVISSMPARAIASWASKAMRETNCRDLIEIGPGNGTLAAAVIQNLPWSIRWKTHLHLVESSEALSQIQRKTLGRKAQWHRSPAEALKACHGRAVIFSNELVDAFPVRRFQNTADGWQELMLTMRKNGDPIESLEKISTLPASSSFHHDHPIAQWIEIHESYQQWLAEWMLFWKAGRMLTIDYGNTAQKIYHRRPAGTLRAYHFQQMIQGTEIYRHPGQRDLTADVNFTDLSDWSRPWTSESQLVSFANFLKSHAQVRDESDRFLVDENGAGAAFMALDQSCC